MKRRNPKMREKPMAATEVVWAHLWDDKGRRFREATVDDYDTDCPICMSGRRNCLQKIVQYSGCEPMLQHIEAADELN